MELPVQKLIFGSMALYADREGQGAEKQTLPRYRTELASLTVMMFLNPGGGSQSSFQRTQEE